MSSSTRNNRGKKPEWRAVLEWKPSKASSGEAKTEEKVDPTPIFAGDLQFKAADFVNLRDGIIKVFLSSTFADFGDERNRLLEDVVPFLQTFAAQYGLEFHLAEMRWGVTEKTVRNNKISDICQREIIRCQQDSVGINFALFLGNRYGYRPLPRTLTPDALETAVKDMPDLAKLYVLNTNLVPEQYELVPEPELEEGELDPNAATREEAVTYLDPTSITEVEANLGYLGLSAESKEKAVYYERNIQEIDGEHAHFDDTSGDESRAQKLASLKERARNGDAKNVRVFAFDSIQEGFRSYLDAFADGFCADMVESIKSAATLQVNTPPPDEDLAEVLAHHNHATSVLPHFVGREQVVDDLLEHCLTGKGAVVLHAESGKGKTSVLAKVAERVRESAPSSVMLLRFLGTTPRSTTSRPLAQSFLAQLQKIFPQEYAQVLGDTIPTASEDPGKAFRQVLRTIHLKNPSSRVVLIVDSIDQLDEDDAGRTVFTWLPPLTGNQAIENVAILLSSLPNECLEALDSAGVKKVALPEFTTDNSEEALALMLKQQGRSLTADQRAFILQGFKDCPSPLYLRMAFERSLSWASYDGVPSEPLPTSVSGLLALWFEEIRQDHGEHLVRTALAHLTASPGGVGEIELERMLSLNDAVLGEVFYWHKVPPATRQVPTLLLAQVMEHIQKYVSRRTIDGVSTIAWYHRQFKEAAERFVLGGDPALKLQVHKDAIKFYSQQSTRRFNGSINRRKLHQLGHHSIAAKDWATLEKLLTASLDPLLAEYDTVNGNKGLYAMLWRTLLKEKPGVSVDETVSELAQATNDAVVLLRAGEFLAKYFDKNETARTLYQVALKLREKALGPKHAMTLECVGRIGEAYTSMSKYEVALEWCERAHTELAEVLGKSHPVTLESLVRLGKLLKDKGDYKYSLDTDSELLERSVEHYGEEDEHVAEAVRQLARTYYLTGQYPQALVMYKRNLKLREILSSPTDPAVAVALNCVGMGYKVTGDYVQAHIYCQRALDLKVTLLGLENSDTAVTLDNIGSIYHLDGVYDKALEFYNRAWEIKKRTLGEEHADTIMMYGNVGRLHHDAGRKEEALPLLLDNLNIRTRVLAEDHPQIAVAQSALAALYNDLERYSDALELGTAAVTLRDKVLGVYHPYVALALDNVALSYHGLGKKEQAKKAANRSLAIRVKSLTKEHPRTGRGYITLGVVTGKKASAEEGYEILKRTLREGHPLIAQAEELLANWEEGSTRRGKSKCSIQ